MCRGRADGHLGLDALGTLGGVESQQIATVGRALDALHHPRRPHLLSTTRVSGNAGEGSRGDGQGISCVGQTESRYTRHCVLRDAQLLHDFSTPALGERGARITGEGGRREGRGMNYGGPKESSYRCQYSHLPWNEKGWEGGYRYCDDRKRPLYRGRRSGL